MQQIVGQINASSAAAFVIGAVIASVIVIAIYQIIAKVKVKTLKEDIQRQIDGAQKEADNIVKTAKIEAAEEKIKIKEQFNAEANKTRSELRELEIRLGKKEDTIERRLDQIQQKENALKSRNDEIDRRVDNLSAKEKELNDILNDEKKQLLKISSMSSDQAREMLLKRLEDECEHEMSQVIQRKIEETKENVDEKSREIISAAIQRYASEQTCDISVSTVEIPSDDMKGRIIGREGRNIRAFEKSTGVDVIVDDTPGMIIVSGFNPVRREVARLAMDKLIQDGRIHPSRIEEVVQNTRKEVNNKVLQIGKNAAVEANVRGLNNRILSLLGALNYRTSYGQNVLRHSIEVAFLSQIMSDELGLDGTIARRAGLLHDIGKAIDHEIEGGHPAIGANFLKRFNESDVVLNAVSGHHGDVPPDNPYTPLIAAADAISASRPGARRETLERYIKRLEKLEEIAGSFEGVENAYAIQAGREIRVIVDAEKIKDELATKIAREIANKVEKEMTYPGEIQVTLLREVRCIEYAK